MNPRGNVTWNRGLRSNSLSPPVSGDQMPRPREDYEDQIPFPRAGKRRQIPGYAQDGGGGGGVVEASIGTIGTLSPNKVQPNERGE